MMSKLPPADTEKSKVLNKRAWFVTKLVNYLYQYKLQDEAQKVETRFYKGELMDQILWVITYNWAENIALDAKDCFKPNEAYAQRMERGSRLETEMKAAKRKEGMSGSLEYIWAARNGFLHKKDFDKFRSALELAVRARSVCSGYKHQGPQLKVLLDNAQKVYDATIPSVRAYVAKQQNR